MKTATENAGDIRIPHSRQAEAAVLGAMIMSREGQDIALEAGMDEKCIYSPDYVKVFRVIMELRDRDKPIDPVTVSSQLVEDKNYVELCQEVTEMSSQFTTTAMVEGYVHLLRELSIRRDLIATCQEAVSMAGNVGVTPEEPISCLQNALDGFLSRNAPGTISDAAGIVEACIQNMERVKFETGPDERSVGICRKSTRRPAGGPREI
jgi:Replicative DNA helicase